MRQRSAAAICTIATLLALAPPTFAQIGRAPDGDAAEVAQQIIQRNFPTEACPLVIDARRVGDGSIVATCNNDEIFRIFSFDGKDAAMRCSAAQQLGISGC